MYWCHPGWKGCCSVSRRAVYLRNWSVCSVKSFTAGSARNSKADRSKAACGVSGIAGIHGNQNPRARASQQMQRGATTTEAGTPMVVVVFEVNFACFRGVFFGMLLLTSFGSCCRDCGYIAVPELKRRAPPRGEAATLSSANLQRSYRKPIAGPASGPPIAAGPHVDFAGRTIWLVGPR